MSGTNSNQNPFATAGDGLGAGIDALFGDTGNAGAFEIMVNLDDIEIKAQVREEFDDEHNSLADLGRSLRRRQIQAILLRPTPAGSDKPYELVAGERRIRAARLEGLAELRARVEDMSDEEAKDLQFAENIHRLNLSQIEEAKKIQRDLDELGSTDAVLEKHHKSRSWLSKMLALLSLPEQTKRLVAENISADLEVIGAVKAVEKADPAEAKKLVDDLKKTRGKENAREKATAVKDKVKPPKNPREPKESKGSTPPATPKWLEEQRKKDEERAAKGSGQVATPKDREHEAPGPVEVFAGAKDDIGSNEVGSETPAQEDQATKPAVKDTLNRAYGLIFEHGTVPKMFLDTLQPEEKEQVSDWLRDFYDTGKQAKDVGRAVIQGFRNGQFAADGFEAFALVAFLHGADSEAKFDLVNILAGAKA